MLQLDLASMAAALGQVVVALEDVLHEGVLGGEAGGWQQDGQEEEDDSDASDASADEGDGEVRQPNAFPVFDVWVCSCSCES